MLGQLAANTPPDLGERPRQDLGVTVLNPWGGRVPVSFIIDDSTCLVNMAHYGLPQFMEAWPGHRRRYAKVEWKQWPREIPDTFVHRFGSWCREHGVKGKYSVVPYPACVGWIDRAMPGWSRDELRASLKLVREFMVPDWDIHPEMISHTRVIDLQTGRPMAQRPDGSYWMENGGWTGERSVDEIAHYIAYALRLLQNVDLPCEGFTTPGGFGNPRQDRLALAGMQAVQDVFAPEVPHYFKYVVDQGTETQPRVECVRGLTTDRPECIVNVVSCTGDWFGGWTGIDHGEEAAGMDRLITADGLGGRLPEVIGAGAPAAMLCHWPGMYCNGTEVGYRIFQGAVKRLHEHFGERVIWMKVSEMARYWAARELTSWRVTETGSIHLQAPFAAPGFTLRLQPPSEESTPRLIGGQDRKTMTLTASTNDEITLPARTWRRKKDAIELCIDLPKGTSEIAWN